jgi:hypothetical protein
MDDASLTGISGDDVRRLRVQLRDRLRTPETTKGRPAEKDEFGPPGIWGPLLEHWSAAALRAALSRWLVRYRDSVGISADDAWTWLDSLGLTGDPVPVTALAAEAGVTTKTINRRLAGLDKEIAQLLEIHPLEIDTHASRSLSTREILALRAEALTARDPARELDAIDTFAKRNPTLRDSARGKPITPDEDKRYRDSLRVSERLETMAHRPAMRPIRSSARLYAADGLVLTEDPREALRQLERAWQEHRPELFEFLIAHTNRLIPDVAAAGVEARLRFLEVAHNILRDAENLIALRYALAWEAEAAAHHPGGSRHVSVLKARAGQAHIYQMFGHYEISFDIYRKVAEQAIVHPPLGEREEVLQFVNDVMGQVIFTETLKGGSYQAATTALKQMDRITDHASGNPEVRFTHARRRFELQLVTNTEKERILAAPASRTRNRSITRAFDDFFGVTNSLVGLNRKLAAADLGVCWGIRDRDLGTVNHFVSQFRVVQENQGGYANLLNRIDHRLRASARLWPALSEIPPLSRVAAPFRDPVAIPRRATGLMIYPERASR